MRERVELAFNGLMLERLVSRAAKRGVRFDCVKRESPRKAVLVTDRAGAKKLMEMAEEYSLDIREISCGGSGAVLRRVKRAWTFAAAMVLSASLMLTVLSRIWIIDINMLDGGDPSQIETALRDMGITPGVRLDFADARGIQSGISARCASYAYVGARMRGVRLLIEATEVFPVPDVYDYARARDIVATIDAVVYSVDVLAGTPVVSPGQSVKKGDVLIEGSERDTRESARGVNAVGSVIGRVWLKGEAREDMTRVATQLTGRKRTGAELRLWDYSHVLTDAAPFASERVEETFHPIGGVILPLGILKTTRYETSRYSLARDIDEVRASALENALRDAMAKAPEGARVYDKWTDSTIIGNKKLVCRALVEVRLDIAGGTK